MRIFADANYPFLSWRRRAYAVAMTVIVIGVGAMGWNIASLGSWLNYGVDFLGGTLVHVDFHEEVTADELRAVDPSWQITRFGEPAEYEYVIRIPSFEERLDVNPAFEVTSALGATFGEESFSVIRTEAVGPRVGDELQQRALLAILVSFLMTLVYIGFRFQWRFGVATVIGSVHVLIVILGIMAVLRMEVSVAIVAALLTVIGYSLNDSIVVFDRVRENLAKRMRGASHEAIIDKSVNETLPRTVVTSVTTIVTLASLYLFGGAVIRDFALVLILGIMIGTFSSIFVATAALAAIEKKWPTVPKKKGGYRSSAPRRHEQPASV